MQVVWRVNKVDYILDAHNTQHPEKEDGTPCQHPEEMTSTSCNHFPILGRKCAA